jgi:ketosteroid isomerase-like protein
LLIDGDAEKVNVETVKKMVEAFNQHDAAGVEAFLADDAVLTEAYAPADRSGKKEIMKGWKETWKGFSDAKVQHTSIWAAGDYVVTTGVFSGTNDGPYPAAKIWTKTGKPLSVQCLEVTKLEAGKVKKQWLFSNGMAFAAQLGLLPPEKKAKPAPAAAAKPAPAAAAAPPTKPEAATPAKAAAAPATPAAPKAAAPVAPTAPAAPKAAVPAVPPAAPAQPSPAVPPAAK